MQSYRHAGLDVVNYLGKVRIGVLRMRVVVKWQG
jgi:hypothetical protein